MQHLESSGTPVLYVGRTVLKGYYKVFHHWYFAQDTANKRKSYRKRR